MNDEIRRLNEQMLASLRNPDQGRRLYREGWSRIFAPHVEPTEQVANLETAELEARLKHADEVIALAEVSSHHENMERERIARLEAALYNTEAARRLAIEQRDVALANVVKMAHRLERKRRAITLAREFLERLEHPCEHAEESCELCAVDNELEAALEAPKA